MPAIRMVGAGLGRTGTLSLKLALEKLLGAPCYHMMAVRPELQGKGVGGALLRDALRVCARTAAPIVLTTHKAINVRFYLREGFFVTHEEQVSPAGAAPYTVWCMRRDAGSA